MKDAKTIAAFAAAVKAKVEKAEAIGSKTTWTTDDHLAALAKAIATAVDPQHDEAFVELALGVLKDAYNISAFQQTLAKVPAFVAKGHFQRESVKQATASDLYKALGVT